MSERPKGKQPYMPLYIGDWEQDTNCLTIEAEGAWLKLCLKCWRNKGVYTASPDSIQRLWRVSPEKFASILLELRQSKVGEFINTDNGALMVICRRHVREFEISAKRAEAGSKGGSKNKANGIAKHEQIPEYENEVDIDNRIEIKESVVENFATTWAYAFDEINLGIWALQFSHLKIEDELAHFKLKCNADPKEYHTRDFGGLRKAFLYQLKNTKDNNGRPKKNLTPLDNL